MADSVNGSNGGEPSPDDRINAVKDAALAALAVADSADALQEWRNQYIGRSGEVTLLLRSVGSLPAEQRAGFGQAANRLKNELEGSFDTRQAEVTAASGPAGAIDVSLPGRKPSGGRLHPITQTVREITAAFGAMGFQTVEGPEVELDRYNFNAMNIPDDHPARDMFDTFWLDRVDEEGARSILLRTHTSPMQARVMEAQDPPIRVVVPGRCYRYEATDASHEWHFNQVEVMAVDEGITFADLKGTLFEFARRVFGPERKVRFRCDFFPFVEPGVDMAVDCFNCEGDPACRICRGSRWLEILGAGMVHPDVLRRAGYDPERYSGFAAGMGVERVAMLKHGIDDIRHFYANDMRFLSQF
ncbi:MAG: phenylalanine--tRNA ligase subunit alpha [Chloroflexi bacterium]|nr:phenylalanine--tRNA ligase subunit alpha [Chloroflexota bacterium]MBT4072523.1 phenylalanine--tRNA ligase subunit alpha [Chloroflexota bacterium]MBT4513644.1 phenylalanine--tRNA ligase subunit alpha [Chloroflexota bacterium]MBT6680608.1 phenylalanine--tRNA ligase subunit alpha [Chloroflexota bacterium]